MASIWDNVCSCQQEDAAGAEELVICRYKSFSILFYECEDINEVYWKWNARLKNAYKASPKIDGSGDVDTLEKIFDLNQQLRGALGPY